MFKKIAFATVTSIWALTAPVLASPEKSDPDADVPTLTDDKPLAETGAEEDAPKAYDPFAEFRDIALKRPLIEQPAPDPARLKIAEQVLSKLMADGTYGRITDSMQSQIMQPLIDRVWNMKGSEFGELFGVKDMPESSKDQTLAEAVGKDDPYAKQRVEAYMHTYFRLISQMGSAIEPDIRGAITRDFARKYDLAQLNDFNRFLTTPSGSVFARDYMLSNLSLDVLQTSLMVWPKMLDAVPDFAKQLENADAGIPKPPKPAHDGTNDENTPECGKDGDYSDCTSDDYSAAADAQKEKERAAWSKKDRVAVEKAEAQLTKAQDVLDAQYVKVDTARSAADLATETARTNAGQAAPTESSDMVMPPPVQIKTDT